MGIILHDRSYAFPDELGRVHVSPASMSISPAAARTRGTMARDSKRGKKGQPARNADKKAIDDIWRHMGLGHIDISYACAGYSMDGRPILNYNEFVDLLVNYGFKIDVIADFISDFSEHSRDKKSPIVMISANSSAIMSNVEPIVQDT